MKSDFYLEQITKKQSEEILLAYHYLKDVSKGFKSGYNYGLFKKSEHTPFNDTLVGVCIFTGLPVPEIAKGAFGLERNQQSENDSEGTTVRVLKNRFTGWCGVSGSVKYNESTGRMLEFKEGGKKQSAEFDDSFETDF